jgi:hypothetical protein
MREGRKKEKKIEEKGKETKKVSAVLKEVFLKKERKSELINKI